MLDLMGDALTADPDIVDAPRASLQSIDIVGQILGHIAAVVRSSDPAGAVERIGMARPERPAEAHAASARPWQCRGRSPRAAAMAGRYFDEWQVGDRIAHAVTRTVTETDNVLISALTHNPQPMHLDHEAAAKSEFGKPLVNSIFTFGLMIGVSVADTTLGTLVANLGYDQLRIPQPGVHRRHAAQRKRMHRGPRKQVAAQCRHRHLGPPQLQPAR